MKCIFLRAYKVLALAIMIFGQSYAQSWERELYFRNISPDDGLSNPTVNCIHQDARGYMWFGTVDGLNRYDGYEFKIYQSNPADSNSLPSNRIKVLYEDSNFNLWIGTQDGLCQFNYKYETFKNYKSGDNFDQVYDIAHDRLNKRMWIVSSNGKLRYLDLQSGIVETYDNDRLAQSVVFRSLIIDDELYIGTSNNGLYKLGLSSFILEEFCSNQSGQFRIPSNWITALHYYNNQLLIGTEVGLVKYSFKDGKSRYFSPQNSTLPNTSVLSIAHNSQGDIFIGTEGGLAILNDQTQLVSFHQKEEGSLATLSSSLIRTVFVDGKDDLWVGMIQTGIDYLNKESRSMTLVKKKYGIGNTLSGSSITSFAQDNKSGIWIGTKEKGLSYYANGQYRYFEMNGSNDNNSNNKNVTDICIDNKDQVWISIYHRGLFTIKNGQIKHFLKNESNPNALQTNKIRKIDVGIDGVIWLASEEGLESYNVEKNIFSHHYIDRERKGTNKRKNIRSLLSDSEGMIYAGTNTGLYVYDPVSGRSDHYQTNPYDSNALPHNIIIEIFEDSKKRIWLGSLGGGLIRFEKENKTFKSYTLLNRFPDNSIKSIEEDDLGNLWMGTNKGIVRFTPATEQVVIFGKSHGLQGNAFSINASTKCRDGRMIFGGPQGFNVFNPNELEAEKNELEVIITDLKLFGESVTVFDENDVLTKNISLVESLRLLYQQSKLFSVYFSALQFADPYQVRFAYMLEGFDNKWNFIGKVNSVSFTNLEPGNYMLKVMASDNGIWDNPVRELKISIPAPWYMTSWFKLGVIIFIVVLMVSFYFYKRYEYRKRHDLLERLVKEKNKEISYQNEELLAINEELVSKNEAVVKQKDFIDDQNIQLTKVQDELKMANLTLEEKIKIRTKELVESNRTLDKTVKELDRFVYSASHDLSAPLKSVLGLVNIAKLDDKGGNLQVHLNYIEDSIIKQENVIKNLIQYSRNARQAIKPEPVNLFNLVNQVILDLRYLPGSDQVNMINNLAEEEVIVTDDQRMKIVLTNLLSNGIKYQDRNKNDSFVKIDLTKDANFWRLVVEDNGQGIAEDQKKKIFDMFYRANEQSEGSGLGLFIVVEAVERLEGTISVKSSLNKGSVFELQFPFL